MASRRSSGFSLIEILVAMALLSLLAGATAAVSVRVLRGNLRERALLRMRAILTAMVGDAERGDHGYLGDMGELPEADLIDLFIRGGRPAGIADAVDGIMSGYNGPYILEGADAARGFVDPWNTPYVYAAGVAQLTSLGPDRQAGGGDDIQYPSVAPVLSGTVTVLVKGQLASGGPPIALRSDEATVQVTHTSAATNTRAFAPVSPTGGAGSGTWRTNNALHLGRHAVIVTGLNASGAGGHNFAGSAARDVVNITRGSVFVSVLLEEAP
jgi:prepilin-type N-terminal cleavage/methylation domain-containing protein